MIQSHVTNQVSLRCGSPFPTLLCMASETLFFLPLHARILLKICLVLLKVDYRAAVIPGECRLCCTWCGRGIQGTTGLSIIHSKGGGAAETETITTWKDPCKCVYTAIGVAVDYSFPAPSWSQWALFQWPEGRLICSLRLLQQGQNYPRRKVTTQT